MPAVTVRGQTPGADKGHDVAGLGCTASMAVGRSVMKRIRIERHKIRTKDPWLEDVSLDPLSLDPRDPDIVRAKALAQTTPSGKAPGK
jgi:hypothetical protein